MHFLYFNVKTDKESSCWVGPRLSRFTSSTEDANMQEIVGLSQCKIHFLFWLNFICDIHSQWSKCVKLHFLIICRKSLFTVVETSWMLHLRGRTWKMWTLVLTELNIWTILWFVSALKINFYLLDILWNSKQCHLLIKKDLRQFQWSFK